MEPEVDAVKDSSQKSVDKLFKDPTSLLIPETPAKKREDTAKSKLDLKFIDDDDSNLHTPKETVFDPFVNGSENLEDPYGKISRQLDFELGRIGQCESDPGDPEEEEEEEDEEEEVEEEGLLGRVLSENLLDAIVSNQADELLLLSPTLAGDDSEFLLADGFKTPTMSSTSFCGIAETCPAAPRKPAISRTLKINTDLSLCKKLLF